MVKRFAEIDQNSTVVRVVVAESLSWCEQNLQGLWVETFKDKSQRYNYAGKSYTYDEDRDAFIPPKPFDSWVLNENTCLWEAPIPYPEDGEDYVWNEETTSWDLVVSDS